MNTEPLKNHFRTHKTKYYIGAGALVCTGVGMIIGAKSDYVQVNLFGKNIITETYIEKIIAQGDPGNIVRNIDTGELFASQSRAAAAIGVHPVEMSRHLNGHLSKAGGMRFERLGKAFVPDLAA